ncbi:helix-turn-helix domain-containing protein [Actinokineospora sp. HUAS TT18]|uniref:helix-turn-helix domain-containing protein n=1 Tax=Actinokineospora sp. HUAS TT18 TaxID=3447451 RepID=UPI003F5228BE
MTTQVHFQSAEGRPAVRESLKDAALRNALRKREAGVPTYTVPEAAALLSISQEYLYRLIHGGGFPAIHMKRGTNQGRFVVPALAVERLLAEASAGSTCVDVEGWTATLSGGAA